MTTSQRHRSSRAALTLRADDVIQLRVGEAREAADALVASHADYPAFRAVFRDPRRRCRALRAFFQATVRDAIRHGLVMAVRGQEAVEGVAVWLPPGAFPWSAARKLRAAPALLRVATADLAAVGRFAAYGAKAERAHPTESHWYLVVLGVRPDVQRSGIGSRLLAPGLARADRDGLPCHLETSDPRNVDYYRRFGFEVIDEALPLVPDGPTHIAMRRPARIP